MPSTEDSLSLFSSEIAPTAGQQFAHLPQETYRALLTHVRTLANLASLGWHPAPVPISGAGLKTSLSFRVGEVVALYEVDFQARVVRLLEVTRRLPTEPLTDQRPNG